MSTETHISTWPDFVQYHFQAWEKDAYSSIKKTFEASVVRHTVKTGCSVGVTERFNGAVKRFKSFEFETCPGTQRAAERLAVQAIEKFKELGND